VIQKERNIENQSLTIKGFKDWHSSL